MLKLIIIDDDRNNLELFAEMLKKGFPGSIIIKALNGKEGISFALSEKPDIILLDIFMPEMDGYETGKILASNEKTKFIPVIMLTAAFNDKLTRIKAFKCGASAFLTKPINYGELVAQISAMLRIKKSEDQVRNESEQLSFLVKSRTNELEIQLREQKKIEKELRLTLKKLEKSRVVSLKLMGDLKEENKIRQKVEKKNIELLNKQTALLGTIPDIIMEANNENVYIWANESGSIFFGQDVVGKNADLYSEGTPKTMQIIQSGSKGIEKTVYFESWQQRIDGEKRLLAWNCKSLKDSKGKVIGNILSARDITELKQREEELKTAKEKMEQLNSYLHKVREEERKFISRELHDDLGQLLTAIKIDMGSLTYDRQDIEKSKKKIATIKNLINESIVTVKRLTSQLRPHILDDLGLISAIEWYTKEFQERTKIEIILKIDNRIELPEETELVIFRILQESLTNIAKHSEAKQVWITYIKSNRLIVLEIIDDGIGIKHAAKSTQKSFGLLNMKERAKEINGALEIDSKPKKGTTIRLTLSQT